MWPIKRLSILIGALFFGTLPIFVRNLQMPPIQIAFLRVLSAIPLLTIFMILLKEDLKTKDSKFVFLLGVSNIICMVGYISAIKMIEVATAGLLLYMAPIYVVPLSLVFLQERLKLSIVPTIVLAFTGLLLLLSVYEFKLNIGVIYGMLSGVGLALIFVSAKKVRRHLSTLKIVYYQMLVSTILLSPVAFTIDFSHIEWPLILGLGIIPTTLAYVFYFYGMKYCNAFEASILALFEPIFVIIFSSTILKESLKFTQMLGGFLILSSIIILEIIRLKKVHKLSVFLNFFR